MSKLLIYPPMDDDRLLQLQAVAGQLSIVNAKMNPTAGLSVGARHYEFLSGQLPAGTR